LVKGVDRPMPNVTADGITLINFGMGSPNAATVMDLLSAIAPKAVLFLGKCGGLKRKNQIGDLILPIAAIRGEGASIDYLPPEVPARVPVATRGVNDDPRPRLRLLDRYCVHDQSSCLGTR
jgi:AMP nucleosidase